MINKARIMTWFGVAVLLLGWVSSASAAPKVELVSSGSGAKAPLVFNVPQGFEQSMAMSWSIKLNMDMAGFKVDMNDLPSVKMRFSAVSPQGSQGDVLEYKSTLGDVSLSDSASDSSNPMVAEMKSDLQALRGMTSLVKMKTNGEMVSNQIQSQRPKSDSMGEQLLNALDESAIIFPNEPVGVGAKWTMTEDVDQQGVKVRRVTTLQLKERNGNQVTIGFAMKGDVMSKVLDSAPGLPPGARATIDTFVMTGTGTMVYDLTRLFPVESDVTVNVQTAMNIESQGQTASASSGMSFKLSVEGE